MLDINNLFNETYYLAENPDVAAAVSSGAFTSGLQHFSLFGQFERRDPSALFSNRYYLANNPDIAAAVESNLITSPFGHFIAFGQRENRNPSALFDSSYYLANNPDVAAAVGDNLTAIQHFVLFGQFEGRRPGPLFNDAYYRAKNPDVDAAATRDEITGIAHYLSFGAAEERSFNPFITPGGSTLPNGVAAGDVTQTSAVLWTRTTVPGSVTFEYSTNPNFSSIIANQTVTATDPTVPVQVEVTGLNPNTQYYYRATDANGTTAAGKFSTPANVGTRQGLRFGVSGDWQGELAPYPSISNVPQLSNGIFPGVPRFDFFVQLGDTIEADSISPDLPGIRQSSTLAEFRTKHNEIYSDRFGLNPWANLRASLATYATWDDHEITNDFAGGAAPAASPQRNGIFGTATEGFVNDTPVFDAALRAFLDYKPLREEFYSNTGDARTDGETKLYRYNTHGSDAATFVLDTRSFRDKPLTSIPETASQEQIDAYLADAFAPGRTMLGAAQLQELKTDLLAAENAGITWKFIFSTVPMQNFGIPVAGERWEGFAAERTDLLKFIEDNNIANVVFVTGDFHGHVVNNVTYQEGFRQPQIPTNMIDVMVGPVAIQLNIGQGPFVAPFGPATVAFTPDALLPPEEKERYRNLTTMAEKDQFVRDVVDRRITPLGYDPIGLENSSIDAELRQGSYIQAHKYGWTGFNINQETQELTVTTWGVEPYTLADIEANPQSIANQTPIPVSSFVVYPELIKSLPAFLEDAITANISSRFNIDSDSQEIVSAHREIWPDTLLGLSQGEISNALTVPGWEVTVTSGELRFVYRTNDNGSVIRLDQAASTLP
ncbi:MAG: hypothetical protein Fur0025_32300 [Oscillatoriaceae cyanobacterium]